LLLLSPLPSLNHAYSLLIRDEKQREVQISHHPAESAFVAAQQPHGGQKVTPAKKFNMETKKGTQFCNYCKKQNHTIENCYRMIGFASDFKFTKSKRFNGAKSNAAVSMETSDSQPNSAGDQPMTQDQFHSLYQLLQQVKVGSQIEQTDEETVFANCAGIPHSSSSSKTYISVSLQSISWIFYSGASEHMTSDLQLLFNVKLLPKPVYV
ncbi:hypothetical protein A4A49_58350, partial [Nicotiana attenuata]